MQVRVIARCSISKVLPWVAALCDGRDPRQNAPEKSGCNIVRRVLIIPVNPAEMVADASGLGRYRYTTVACGSRCRPTMLRIKRAMTCAVASPTSRAG